MPHVFFESAEAPTASTSTTHLNDQTPLKSKRQHVGAQTQSPSPSPLKPTKRARTVNYDSAEEEDDDDTEELPSTSNGNGNGNGNGIKMSAKAEGKRKAKEQRKEMAQRLLPLRQKLPIWEGKEAIMKAIEENPTVVILGETGSGKTTQIPQFLLHSSIPHSKPRICVTQPRRVAATTLASRVSSEVGCILGTLVGYTVRFDDVSSPTSTRLKYVTDGTLLAEMLGDKDLERYDVVVVDEAHERSLRTDMVLGFLKAVQKRRSERRLRWKEGDEEDKPSELKIVVMSATLDAKRFSTFFNEAPVLYIKGRQFTVKIHFADEPVEDYVQAALQTVFLIHTKYPAGDILVFLPGQEDIENLGAAIRTYAKSLDQYFQNGKNIWDALIVCPLYAKLSPTEQQKAFVSTPMNTRKVILATNVAETSVTIPGVTFVIDTGLAKEKEYHSSVGIDTLVTEKISRSSAQQRTGRAGRERQGWCFRLYTEKSFLELPIASRPEIQRVSLTFAILHLLAAGQEDVWKFDFMDRPRKEKIVDALLQLHGLEAIDSKSRITPFGRQMALLPLEPTYARILLSSFHPSTHCASEIIDLLALNGSKDTLLINSIATREAANSARAKFVHRSGDHLTLLNILRAFEDVGKEEKKNWCKDHYISLRALSNVLDARKQLRERCERMGLDWEGHEKGKAGKEVGAEEMSERVLGCLVTGLFANTAMRQPDGTYLHTMNRQVINIHPGSAMYQKKAPAIVYDELVLTTKRYARGVSAIEMSWLRTRAPAMFNATANKILA